MRGSEGLTKKSGLELKAHLRGKIAHVQRVNPKQGEKLLALFNSMIGSDHKSYKEEQR